MDIKLINDKLLIDINRFGAELKSIKKVNDKTEYLWQGHKDSWTSSSPILFPIVGALNNDRYSINNKEYSMSQHGFARKTEFETTLQKTDKVEFRIKSCKDSLNIYPFKFELLIGYELIDNRIIVSYEVKNRDNKEISFQIGGHPGFNCPLDKGLKFQDYNLIFNRNENSQRRFKTSKVLSGVKEAFFNNNNTIRLKHELFTKGALIFDDLKSNQVTLESEKDSKKVVMDFTGFPYFGIWTWPPAPANYICLEPWYGVDSTEGDSPDWNKKEGLVSVKCNETFRANYSIQII